MFEIGLKTGLRVSDILNLRVGDIKKSTRVKEKKTGKERTVKFSEGFIKDVQRYAAKNYLKNDDCLVFSDSNNKNRPLSRVQAYVTLRYVGAACGVERVGTHSMRKTFAVAHFKKHKDIEQLKKILNHKHVTTTLLYLFNTKDISKILT
jgi:site-specific recombinase XerD